jgi:heterodisulfide reductase subunit D
MKITTTLNDVHRPVTLCLKDMGCTYGEWPENLPLCPLYTYDKCYASSPGGLVYLARAILDGNYDYSQSMSDLVFSCAGCGVCNELCGPLGVLSPHAGPWDVIKLLRNGLVQRQLLPDGKIKELYQIIQKSGDFPDKGEGVNLKVPDKIKSDKATSILYAECFHSPAQQKIYQSALKLLEKIAMPISTFSDGGCCGSTLYDYGFWEGLKELVQGKWEKMKELNAEEFIFINPHCQEFVVNRYPEILEKNETSKARHLSEVLLEAFKQGKLKSSNTKKMKVTYHDPCYLGRGLGIYDAPRDVLTSVNNVELVEMTHNRDCSFCCGARATGSYSPDFHSTTANYRLAEFHDTGADLLITSCPYCKEAFQKVLPDKDKEKVKDLIEFVADMTD